MKTTEPTLIAVPESQRNSLLPYLLLADNSEEAVQSYLFEGEMFSISYEDETAGVILFTFPERGVVEIKNIALDASFRHQGLGKKILHRSTEQYKEQGFRKMIVGTANSSLDNVAFYQKAGFRMNAVKKDFFKDYPEGTYENGILTLDMLMFEKDL